MIDVIGHFRIRLMWLITSATMLLHSSGCKESFHRTEDGTMAMKEVLTGQFGGNSQFAQITLFYDPTVGNSLSVTVRNAERPMMMDDWVYLNVPVNVGRNPGMRSIGRFQIGSIGEWTKRSERFIDTSEQRYMHIDDINWELIPSLYEIAEQDMMARGVPEPRLNGVTFLRSPSNSVIGGASQDTLAQGQIAVQDPAAVDNQLNEVKHGLSGYVQGAATGSPASGRLTATVIASTMGGGSTITYEFDMTGKLVRPPG